MVSAWVVGTLSEKEFYLEEFRGRTLVLAADRGVLAEAVARRALNAVVKDLMSCGARVIVVLGRASSRAEPVRGRGPRTPVELAWRSWLRLPGGKRTAKNSLPADVLTWSGAEKDENLASLWRILRRQSLCLVLGSSAAAGTACEIAAGLRVAKLVLLDAVGGLVEARGRRRLSYLDGVRLDDLLSGSGEGAFRGASRRPGLLQRIDAVLDSGVSSVNLCRVEGLALELFTYEGSGTFISRVDHCRVGPLAIDDFPEVESLLARGQREGLLKQRSLEELSEVLLQGFGVWVGPGHLAGVGALRSWDDAGDAVGEIIGLYTFTRFKGEGIGGKLIDYLAIEASRQKMTSLFAVTASARAARFFLRQGFEACEAGDVPARKWQDYDSARRGRVSVFRRPLVSAAFQTEQSK